MQVGILNTKQKNLLHLDEPNKSSYTISYVHEEELIGQTNLCAAQSPGPYRSHSFEYLIKSD